MVTWLLALGGSYLIGSIPTAYLLVKRLKGVDVRTVGSGNVGATNVTRTAGLGAGAAVFLVDAMKGLAAVWGVAPALQPEPIPMFRLVCGAAAVVGHIFPVFLKFRGGKGVATTIGVLVSLSPVVALTFAVVWVLVFLLTRYVSAASIAAAAAIPVGLLLDQRLPEELLLGAALAVLIVIRHRANIQRLMQGTEHRFGHQRDARRS
jgi:glycerol-3-phosphate acyltransferase PlsY